MSTKTVHKYLCKYAEPEARELISLEELQFQSQRASFVLPIFNESISDLERFLSMPECDGLLSVWVFNAPVSCSDDARTTTQESLQYFKSLLNAKSIAEGIYQAEVSPAHKMVLIDRCSAGREIPDKQGVGLARKLGADVALAVSQESFSWLFFSDADATLPGAYFQSVFALPPDVSAMVYPFEHLPEAGLELETALYDFKLHYYLEMLSLAKSPYAYHALGSTMAVSVEDYARVRGVPKRAAGEDFYLLNKLAKIRGVKSLTDPILQIAGRGSDRVPFGTGPAITKISALNDPLTEFKLYNPKTFKALASLLELLNNTARNSSGIDEFEAGVLACEKTSQVFAQLRFERFLHHARKQNVSGDRFVKSFHEWFDAFVTLKFVHLMRDLGNDDVPFRDLKEKVGCWSNALSARYLRVLELEKSFFEGSL